MPEGKQTRARVLIVYTGGTFGMHYNGEGVLVPFDFSRILAQLPAIRKLKLDLSVASFEKPIDSSNISPRYWQAIAGVIADHYGDFDGFVVLHGTDTMAYTASALSFMLEGLSKPVVLTGAQLPISEPRSDARENLITALEIGSAKIGGHARVPEVCIYFNYELLRGNRTRKVQSMQFDAFNSGNYPALARAGVTIVYNDAAIMRIKERGKLIVKDRFDPHVTILKVFPGLSPDVFKAVLSGAELQGVILETYGSGNVPGERWIFEAIEGAIAAGKIILNISQCPGGRVVQGKYENSKRLKEIGVIGGGDMTTEAAVTKLMLLLGEHGIEAARAIIAAPLAGEMSVEELR